MNSIIANLQRYGRRMVYGLIIFYSLFSLLSLHFIIFSSLSHLFSLTNSLSPIPSFLFKFVEIFFLLQFKISLTVAIITGGMDEAREFIAHGGHGSRVCRSRRTSHRHCRCPRREGPSSSSSLSNLADISLFFLVVGCFDCCWLADFG